tara:strand:- start:5 stop:379 length:375 start_codon:yes stop_codon:yes gene_type:complete
MPLTADSLGNVVQEGSIAHEIYPIMRFYGEGGNAAMEGIISLTEFADYSLLEEECILSKAVEGILDSQVQLMFDGPNDKVRITRETWKELRDQYSRNPELKTPELDALIDAVDQYLTQLPEEVR